MAVEAAQSITSRIDGVDELNLPEQAEARTGSPLPPPYSSGAYHYDDEYMSEPASTADIQINASLHIDGNDNIVTFAPAAAALYMQNAIQRLITHELDGSTRIVVDCSVMIKGDRNVVGGAAAAMLLRRPASERPSGRPMPNAKRARAEETALRTEQPLLKKTRTG